MLSAFMFFSVPKPRPKSKSLPQRRKPLAQSADELLVQCEDDKKTSGVQSKDIQGLKYFDMLIPLLERLHDG